MSDEELAAFAAASIARGSKSFAAAARLFDKPTRQSVVMLYAWCRHCDDVVDGQDGGSAERLADDGPEAKARIEGLRRDTEAAFAGRTEGLAPAFAALAAVARRHAIPQRLAEEHLDGFGMDVEGRSYESLDDLMLYCWRVAGVVGVMMARIMGVSDAETLRRAGDLGLAFQLTNIARDVVDDARAGRVYAPLAWLWEEGVEVGELTDPARAGAVLRVRRRLVAAAEPYYASARIGIGALPRRSAWAIATALLVYRAIGLKLLARGEAGFSERVATTTSDKAGFVLAGAAMALRTPRPAPRDPALWTPRG